VTHGGDQALGARGGVLSHPEHRDDHVLRHQLEVDVVEFAHQRRDANAGAARAPNVDRQSQRVPAVDPGTPHESLVQHG
jgi:hypothetical protein